jgi:hypothetical protein
MLETGYLRSNQCLENNNLFGWFGNVYLSFPNWITSIKYYSEWQQKYYKGGDYYKFLEEYNFAEDKDYIKKLKQMER